MAVAGDRQRLVEEAVQRFGGIDLLVNNAGVAPERRADILSLADANEASFDRVIGINLKGPYFLTQIVAKQMLAQAPDAGGSRGRIVNIKSICINILRTLDCSDLTVDDNHLWHRRWCIISCLFLWWSSQSCFFQ